MAAIDDDSPWTRSAWAEVGTALLVGGERTMTASELARALGKDASNTAKVVKEMVTEGLLVARKPRVTSGARGRRPDAAYTFARGQVEELEKFLAEHTAPGALRRGQQLVFAAVTTPHLEDLLHVLGDREVMAQAAWAALCDGAGHEYVVVFDGDDPAQPALDLMAALTAAEIDCHQRSVAQVAPAHQLAQRARRAARAAERARIRRQTRRASA